MHQLARATVSRQLDITYLFCVTVPPLDFALAAALQVLLDLNLGANLVALARVEGAVGQKNLKVERGERIS